jgi:hypothetical protein
VFVIADDNEVPAVPLDTVAAHIKIAQSIYASECQVRLEASKPMVVTGQTHLLTSHDCGFLGWFSPKKGDYNSFAFPGTVAAIYVKDVPKGSAGCHIPGTQYVLVDRDAKDDTLAHELGHACDLFRHRNGTPENLMASGSVRTASKLTKWQCCVVRTSDNVTWT